MSRSTTDPVAAQTPDGRLGLVVEDQRTGDLRQVLYADGQVVLLRDESGATTLQSRGDFERSLGSRLQPRPDAQPSLDGGPFADLRRRLEDLEREDGRTAAHKAEAIRESLEIFAPGDAPSADEETTAASDPAEADVDFEDVPGIGPKTAGNLRTHGFVTERDVRQATDEELLSVAGLGPESLANLRTFVD